MRPTNLKLPKPHNHYMKRTRVVTYCIEKCAGNIRHVKLALEHFNDTNACEVSA